MRSALEEKIAIDLERRGIAYKFESLVLPYVRPAIPARNCRYTPDFILENGIIIEAKGQFSTKDRAKHLLIREQLPHLDIRFVFHKRAACFSDSGARQKTTVQAWCDKHAFMYAFETVPEEWLRE